MQKACSGCLGGGEQIESKRTGERGRETMERDNEPGSVGGTGIARQTLFPQERRQCARSARVKTVSEGRAMDEGGGAARCSVTSTVSRRMRSSHALRMRQRGQSRHSTGARGGAGPSEQVEEQAGGEEVLPRVLARQSREPRPHGREQIRLCAYRLKRAAVPVRVGGSRSTMPGSGQTPGRMGYESTTGLTPAPRLHRRAPSQTTHDADTDRARPRP